MEEKQFLLTAKHNGVGEYVVKAASKEEAKEKFKEWDGSEGDDSAVHFLHFSEDHIGEVLEVCEDSE